MIKNTIKNHMSIILAIVALIFVGVVFSYFSWGIGYLVTTFNSINNGSAPASQVTGFNLDDAAKLNYRGLMGSTSTQEEATPTSTVSATSSAISNATATLITASTSQH
jgi:predicted PurR-regulated permease PerM